MALGSFLVCYTHVFHVTMSLPPSLPPQLATLIFIENQLTCIVVNKPEHKLQKAVGYHYDLLLVALLNGVGGIMGMPWVCAASVRLGREVCVCVCVCVCACACACVCVCVCVCV